MNNILAGIISIVRIIAFIMLSLRVSNVTTNGIGFLVVALIFGITDLALVLGGRKVKGDAEGEGGGIGAGWWMTLIGTTVGAILLSAALLHFVLSWDPDGGVGDGSLGLGSILLTLIGVIYLLLMKLILNKANFTWSTDKSADPEGENSGDDAELFSIFN
jgi:hypothetical protein